MQDFLFSFQETFFTISQKVPTYFFNLKCFAEITKKKLISNVFYSQRDYGMLTLPKRFPLVFLDTLCRCFQINSTFIPFFSVLSLGRKLKRI